MSNRSRPAAALAVLLASASAAPAAAQAAQGLTLEEVVARAVTHAPQTHVIQARVDAVRARALTASGRFDTRLEASAAASQQSAAHTLADGLVPLTSQSTAYTVEAVRQLRSGIVVQPRLTVSRTDQEGAAVADGGSSVSLNVAVPLLRDRFGRASTAPERAMRLRAEAGDHDMVYATALGVVQAVDAYWNYVAAHARMEVLAQSEARARRRVEETRTLVSGGERAAADLPPAEAGLARARSQRIIGMQEVDEARTRLGVALGLDLDATGALPAPATGFPALAAWSLDAAEEARLVRLALERRRDLIATVLELRSDDVFLQGAREELKPQLDVQLSVGYAGRQLGGGYLAPLYRDVPGLNASVRVDYQFPVARTAARGAEAQAEAARREKALHVGDLERHIAGNVTVMMRAVEHGAQAVREAERAVALYRTTVDNEQQRSRHGAATLFDVTYAEDNLTGAQLSEVSARLGYTRALVQLRMETGTLAEGSPEGPTVDASTLLTIP